MPERLVVDVFREAGADQFRWKPDDREPWTACCRWHVWKRCAAFAERVSVVFWENGWTHDSGEGVYLDVVENDRGTDHGGMEYAVKVTVNAVEPLPVDEVESAMARLVAEARGDGLLLEGERFECAYEI